MKKFLSVTLLFVLTAIFVPKGLEKDMTYVIFSQKQWGPAYANYYLTDGTKKAFWGPGYVFDQGATWLWRHRKKVK